MPLISPLMPVSHPEANLYRKKLKQIHTENITVLYTDK